MPRYDYKCLECGEVFERDSSVLYRDQPHECPKCYNLATRVLVPKDVGIEFKGKDFYYNEYPKKGSG